MERGNMKNILDCTGHEIKIPDIVDSNGVFLFDSNGKRYMDLESGVWCTALGHGNDRINNAIKKQVDCIIHVGFCYSSEIVDKAAQLLLSIANFNDGKCVFLSSGSEAIEILRQVSKHVVSSEQKTLTLHDAYLGSYSSVINRTEAWFSLNWEKCQTCSSRNTCNFDCKVLQDIPEDISEFIFEPGSASGFVRFPPKALIQNIVTIVRKNNGKVIVNEVTTGIGRTGKWFGYQHYDIEPDMIAVGKGIGNGYPVSAALLNQGIANELQQASTFEYMQGHQNDPLGAAVVREVIQVIRDDDLIGEAEKKSEIFLSKLNSLVDGKIVIGIRGRGLMFAIDLANEEISGEIYNELLDRGYIVCNRGSFLRIDPPLTISKNEFGEFFGALTTIVAQRKISHNKAN